MPKIVINIGRCGAPHHYFSAEARIRLIEMDSELIQVTPWSEWKERNYHSSVLNWRSLFSERIENTEYFSEPHSGIICKGGLVYDIKDQLEAKTRMHKDLIQVVEELGDKASLVNWRAKMVVWRIKNEYSLDTGFCGDADDEKIRVKMKIKKNLPERIKEAKEKYDNLLYQKKLCDLGIKGAKEEYERLLSLEKEAGQCQKS